MIRRGFLEKLAGFGGRFCCVDRDFDDAKCCKKREVVARLRYFRPFEICFDDEVIAFAVTRFARRAADFVGGFNLCDEFVAMKEVERLHRGSLRRTPHRLEPAQNLRRAVNLHIANKLSLLRLFRQGLRLGI